MKIRTIAVCALALLSVFAIAPVSALNRIVATTWQGQTNIGFDPYYGTNINGYKTGSPASLSIVIDNTYNQPIYINGTRLHLGWNQNVSSTPSTTPPIQINQNTVATFSFNFQIPSTTIATNLDKSGQTYSWYINWTGPGGYHTFSTGTDFSSGTDFGSGTIYVLSADQADALTAAQQLPATIPSFGSSYSYCGVTLFGISGFRTSEGSTLCQQSQQQANLALKFYSQADFADAKTSFQTAASEWNQALSADKSTGGNLELGQTVQGWGFLLLGIGAVVAGVGGIVYAFRRPKELRAIPAAAH